MKRLFINLIKDTLGRLGARTDSEVNTYSSQKTYLLGAVCCLLSIGFFYGKNVVSIVDYYYSHNTKLSKEVYRRGAPKLLIAEFGGSIGEHKTIQSAIVSELSPLVGVHVLPISRFFPLTTNSKDNVSEALIRQLLEDTEAIGILWGEEISGKPGQFVSTWTFLNTNYSQLSSSKPLKSLKLPELFIDDVAVITSFFPAIDIFHGSSVVKNIVLNITEVRSNAELFLSRNIRNLSPRGIAKFRVILGWLNVVEGLHMGGLRERGAAANRNFRDAFGRIGEIVDPEFQHLAVSGQYFTLLIDFLLDGPLHKNLGFLNTLDEIKRNIPNGNRQAVAESLIQESMLLQFYGVLWPYKDYREREFNNRVELWNNYKDVLSSSRHFQSSQRLNAINRSHGGGLGSDSFTLSEPGLLDLLMYSVYGIDCPMDKRDYCVSYLDNVIDGIKKSSYFSDFYHDSAVCVYALEKAYLEDSGVVEQLEACRKHLTEVSDPSLVRSLVLAGVSMRAYTYGKNSDLLPPSEAMMGLALTNSDIQSSAFLRPQYEMIRSLMAVEQARDGGISKRRRKVADLKQEIAGLTDNDAYRIISANFSCTAGSDFFISDNLELARKNYEESLEKYLLIAEMLDSYTEEFRAVLKATVKNLKIVLADMSPGTMKVYLKRLPGDMASLTVGLSDKNVPELCNFDAFSEAIRK